jgi:hypothetical protein
MRLDFETMTLLGPSDTIESATSVCQDTFLVTVSELLSIKRKYVIF